MKYQKTGVGSVKPIARQTLSDQVYDSLRKAIIEGELTPGQRITERELAQQMNVSTTPVREAFRRLSGLGLITIVPWNGAVVNGISQHDIIEVAQCRGALEGFAAGIAAEQASAEEIEISRRLVDELQVKEVAELDSIRRIDSEIHNTIINCAGNSRLANMLDSINEIVSVYLSLSEPDDKRIAQIKNEHKEILKALEDKDTCLAETAMRDHIRKSFQFALASSTLSNDAFDHN